MVECPLENAQIFISMAYNREGFQGIVMIRDNLDEILKNEDRL